MIGGSLWETVRVLGAWSCIVVIACLYVWRLGYRRGIATGRRTERRDWRLPVGDGVTDDTEALQRLVNGGLHDLPPGNYRCVMPLLTLKARDVLARARSQS